MKDEKEDEEEKHPYEMEQDNELINSIWNRTKKYRLERLSGSKADIYSLGKVLDELLMVDSTDSKATGIINKMCEEKENKDEIDILFKNVTELFIEHQKNSSLESVVLSLKSFQNLSEILMKRKNIGKKCENKVLEKYIEILSFIKYNYFILE